MWVCTPSSVSSASATGRLPSGAPSASGDAQICLLHHGRADHCGGFAVGDQAAIVQHDDAVGQALHHLHLVLDQQDRFVTRRFQLLMRSRMTGTSSTDMPAVGSSNMNTCGSRAIMMATSSLRLSPCGSAMAGVVCLSARLAASINPSACLIQSR